MTLTRQIQSRLHDPANGSFGNCYQTCLAMALGLDVRYVPDFPQSPTWYLDVRKWLASIGWSMIRILPDPEAGWGGVLLDVEPGAVALHSGLSPRSPTTDMESDDKVLHTVVAVRRKGEWEIIDPHPSGDGLAEPLVAIELLVAHEAGLNQHKHDQRSEYAKNIGRQDV